MRRWIIFSLDQIFVMKTSFPLMLFLTCDFCLFFPTSTLCIRYKPFQAKHEFLLPQLRYTAIAGFAWLLIEESYPKQEQLFFSLLFFFSGIQTSVFQLFACGNKHHPRWNWALLFFASILLTSSIDHLSKTPVYCIIKESRHKSRSPGINQVVQA